MLCGLLLVLILVTLIVWVLGCIEYIGHPRDWSEILEVEVESPAEFLLAVYILAPCIVMHYIKRWVLSTDFGKWFFGIKEDK